MGNKNVLVMVKSLRFDCVGTLRWINFNGVYLWLLWFRWIIVRSQMVSINLGI